MKSVHGHFVILRNIARRTNASPGLSREQSGSIQYGYLHIYTDWHKLVLRNTK